MGAMREQSGEVNRERERESSLGRPGILPPLSKTESLSVYLVNGRLAIDRYGGKHECEGYVKIIR